MTNNNCKSKYKVSSINKKVAAYSGNSLIKARSVAGLIDVHANVLDIHSLSRRIYSTFISEYWGGAGYRNPSSWKTGTRLYYTGYNGWWCHGDARSHSINRHGVNLLLLQCRRNGRNGVSNPVSRLFAQPFDQTQIKKSKLRVTGRCEGNTPVICGFPAQRTSNAEKVSVWWRHHGQSINRHGVNLLMWYSTISTRIIIYLNICTPVSLYVYAGSSTLYEQFEYGKLS